MSSSPTAPQSSARQTQLRTDYPYLYNIVKAYQEAHCSGRVAESGDESMTLLSDIAAINEERAMQLVQKTGSIAYLSNRTDEIRKFGQHLIGLSQELEEWREIMNLSATSLLKSENGNKSAAMNHIEELIADDNLEAAAKYIMKLDGGFVDKLGSLTSDDLRFLGELQSRIESHSLSTTTKRATSDVQTEEGAFATATRSSPGSDWRRNLAPVGLRARPSPSRTSNRRAREESDSEDYADGPMP